MAFSRCRAKDSREADFPWVSWMRVAAQMERVQGQGAYMKN